MAVPRHPVKSSQISYIGYNEDKKELFVTFNTNSTYRYDDVPKEIFDKLMLSNSKGKFLNDHVKNVYVSNKIK